MTSDPKIANAYSRIANAYSRIAKTLHWLIAAMIVAQYVLAKLAEVAKDNDQILDQLALLANHKSIGMTILALAVVRVAYRFAVTPPSLPSSMPVWQKNASHFTHILLYVFLFAMPMTGWLMSSAKAYSVSWFNLLALPDLIAANDVFAEQLKTVHVLLSKALFAIAALHILAALKHHFVDKDSVLTRMAGAFGWALFAITLVLSIGLFGRFFVGSSALEVAVSPSATSLEQSAATKSDLPIWDIDYEQSYIKFHAEQAGAPFTGEWQTWKAALQFNESQLSESRFQVSIDTSSGFSSDQERDDTIRSAEFFDVAQFAEATYAADKFSRTDQGYESAGYLSMKGVSSPVALSFKVEHKDGQLILTGTAPLDRLLWNIGTGDWADTSWVGQEVMVEVNVVTKK